jgi:hypothetical protein
METLVSDHSLESSVAANTAVPRTTPLVGLAVATAGVDNTIHADAGFIATRFPSLFALAP